MKKADNFDAGKWLVENKITFQSRLNEGADKYPFQASPEKIALYDKIANELEKTVSMVANKLGTSESNIRISLDNLWSEKNRDRGMIVQIKADDAQWKEAWTGNALIMQTQNGEGVTVSPYHGTDIAGSRNPEIRAIYNKVFDSDLENLVDSENARIANSLSPEELELIAPNTPVIVTGTQSSLNEVEAPSNLSPLTKKKFDNLLAIAEKAVAEKDKETLQKIYDKALTTGRKGWAYFINSLYDKGLAHQDGAYLKWNLDESRLNEAEDTLEQDLLDFWDTLQDDAAQSDGEYKASWDTDFFLEMHKEYKGREAEVRNAVKQLKQQGKLSLYGKREKGVEGTGSVLDFTKQNIKEIAEVISKKHGFGEILWYFDEALEKPNEFIKGDADLAEIYYTREIYDSKWEKNEFGWEGSTAIPTGKFEKALYIKIAFDKDKITKNKSTGFRKFVVKGTTIYTSYIS